MVWALILTLDTMHGISDCILYTNQQSTGNGDPAGWSIQTRKNESVSSLTFQGVPRVDEGYVAILSVAGKS